MPRHVLVAAVIVCATVSSSSATVVEKLPLDALVAQSQRVVRGTVTSMQSSWDEQGMRIYTRAVLDVQETLKGDAASSVNVFEWGGTVGELGQRVLGEAALRVGDDAVFFLEKAPLADHWRTVGMAQGVWPVSPRADGTLQVSRTAARLTLRVPGQTSGTHAMLPDQGEAPRDYASFAQHVISLSVRGRP